MELLGAVQRLAQYIQVRFKHALACRRPVEYSAQLHPMILTPGHGSLPSGHGCEGYVMAGVLSALVSAAGAKLELAAQVRLQTHATAARVPQNRVVAGVHFPVDNIAGAILGVLIGKHVVRRMTAASGGTDSVTAWRFDGDAKDVSDTTNSAFAGRDFEPDHFFLVDSGALQTTNYLAAGATNTLTDLHSPILHELWNRAMGELS